MTEHEYVREVLRTYAGSDDFDAKICLGALGLAGESGEVVDIIKKVLFQGHVVFIQELCDELGDVLWYLVLICTACGYSLEDVMRRNVEKLRGRYPDGFEVERSVNRVEYEVDA